MVLSRADILRHYGVRNIKKTYVNRTLRNLGRMTRHKERIILVYRYKDKHEERFHQIKSRLCSRYRTCEQIGKKIVLLVAGSTPTALNRSLEDQRPHTRDVRKLLLQYANR